MSANNQLTIIEKKGYFEVHIIHCVDNPFRPSKETLLFKEKDLKEAIRKANNYCLIEGIEYGVYVDI